ncbi:hypothetical protein A2Y99_02940 [Candidatus Gottesmanbacteria bacterium RBG_13_37_7]|uniref:Coenzyme A biosynthesis bifunctional protein CoaBC n=1 Tax=Candidatus Gottesmanbacteria bacterium RBG_13_37_7 TaxID=1798369 RepID=A0A1F5YJB3_9BACT|nr:MAG: hypothetical protein A2Y99_02940 [Candidatus Gottesmanbacteria bacterium RBG_13_37_7]
MKSEKNILIGISSSIAAYKILELIKTLRKKQYTVFIMMTENASKMISYRKFEKATGHKVFIKLFKRNYDYLKTIKEKKVYHIELARKADVLVVAPATANIIGKIAHGIADDFVTTAVLATKAPILICPAMNSNMWTNTAVKENISLLRKRGFFILPPHVGLLVCGTKGVGRLVQVNTITDEIEKILSGKEKLKGNKIMVTAGGTREAVDEVRMLTNRSTGKMGRAIAEEAYCSGAEVLLLRAKTSVIPRYPIKEEIFETAEELTALIKKYLKKYDIIFHTAAVSDFVPEKKIRDKIDSSKPISLRFIPAVKILTQIKKWNPEIKLIGFKAVFKLSREESIEKGMEKLKESRADYIIVNDVGRKGVGFEVDTNEVYIISAKGLMQKIEKTTKNDVARQILEIIFSPTK